jgi:hypothetical protein
LERTGKDERHKWRNKAGNKESPADTLELIQSKLKQALTKLYESWFHMKVTMSVDTKMCNVITQNHDPDTA